MAKVYRHEATKPLMSTGRIKTGRLYLRTKPRLSPLDTEDGPLYKMKKKRVTSLIAYDAVILILEFVQILALMQSMSLRWVWPETWIKKTNFIFLFNLDVWEFTKVISDAYLGIQNYNTPSSAILFSFNFVVLGWGIILGVLFASLGTTCAILYYRKCPYLLVHMAKVEKVVIIISQILALPVGTVVFRLFQCTSIDHVDVLNDITCFTGIHWAYLTPGLLVCAALFILLPGWMIYRTRHELLASNSQHHETYLQLKEMEYMSGLDVIWIVKGFHIFSSFSLRGAHYRVFLHFFKLGLLIIYAGAYQNIYAQSVSVAVLLFVLWLLFIIIRPFRILSFNIMFITGYLCLIGDAVFGASVSHISPADVSSAWLVEPYNTWVLVGINGVLGVAVVIFILYLIIYHFCCYRKLKKNPLWPVMSVQGADKVSLETKKFMQAVLKGRAVLEKCRSVNPMFAPVYELSHQIQVVNAFYREAELLCDGLHDTLWDLLDEMIMTHEKLEPMSLFGDNVKESIRDTAAELLKLLPMFSRRLAQRDYDLILVSPQKKRMLLKMFVMGCFLNGRSEKTSKRQITGPELNKIWPESAAQPGFEEETEYYEDLYPGPLQGPDQEEMYIAESLTLPMDLIDLDEDDEKSVSSILKGGPTLMSTSPYGSRPASSVSCHSTSLQGQDNPAFVSESPLGFVGDAHSSQHQPTLIDLEGYEAGETTTDDLPGPPVGGESQNASHLESNLRSVDSSPVRGQKGKDGEKKKRNRDSSLKRKKSRRVTDGTDSGDNSVSQPLSSSSQQTPDTSTGKSEQRSTSTSSGVNSDQKMSAVDSNQKSGTAEKSKQKHKKSRKKKESQPDLANDEN